VADARETVVKVDAVSVRAAVVGAHGALVGVRGGSGGSCGLSLSRSFGLSLGLSCSRSSGRSCWCWWLGGGGCSWLHEPPDQVEAVEVSSSIRLELDDEVVGVDNLALEPTLFDGVVEPWVVNVAELLEEVTVVGAVGNICLDSESLELVDVHAHFSGGFTADDESKMVPLAVFVLSWAARSMSWVSWMTTCGAIGWSFLFNVHLQDLDEHSRLSWTNNSPSASSIRLVGMIGGQEAAWSVGYTAVLEHNWSSVSTVTADSSGKAGNVFSSFDRGIESLLSSLGTVGINVRLFDESAEKFLVSQGCRRGEKSNSKLHLFFFKSKVFSKKVQ